MKLYPIKGVTFYPLKRYCSSYFGQLC